MDTLLVYYGNESELTAFKKENKELLENRKILYAKNGRIEGIEVNVMPGEVF